MRFAAVCDGVVPIGGSGGNLRVAPAGLSTGGDAAAREGVKLGHHAATVPLEGCWHGFPRLPALWASGYNPNLTTCPDYPLDISSPASLVRKGFSQCLPNVFYRHLPSCVVLCSRYRVLPKVKSCVALPEVEFRSTRLSYDSTSGRLVDLPSVHSLVPLPVRVDRS